mgnify:CR=1 FL=1
MTEKTTLPKDHKLAKASKTMTVGGSAAALDPNKSIDLHGKTLKVIASTPSDTIVQYPNGAQRQFLTADLAAYLDLGTFPAGTAFYRQTDKGLESVFIEYVNTADYIVEQVDADGSHTEVMPYADLAAWHEGGHKVDPQIKLPGGGILYVPKTQPMSAESRAFMNKTADEEADKLAAALEAFDEPDDQPFEADLKAEVDRLNKALEAMEVRSQTTINSLTKQLDEANKALLAQDGIHNTRLLAAADEVAALQRKVEALTNPPPTCKEVCTLVQKLSNPEDRRASDAELAEKLSEGWVSLNTTVTSVESELFTYYTRIVTLVRDLPAQPAPKAAQPAAEEAKLYIGAVPLTPAPQPPMPNNQTIVDTGAPVSIARTHNLPKRHDTKRIPTLASIQARRERDAAEIDAILQKGVEQQEMLRRKFASQPTPFPVTTGVNQS